VEIRQLASHADGATPTKVISATVKHVHSCRRSRGRTSLDAFRPSSRILEQKRIDVLEGTRGKSRHTGTFFMAFANSCGMLVIPGSFDRELSRVCVPHFCDSALLACLPGRSFRRHQNQECHQLPRLVEPTDVASFRNHGRCIHQGEATHSLERGHHWRHRPGRRGISDGATTVQLCPKSMIRR
jgi:hypothetical protein